MFDTAYVSLNPASGRGLNSQLLDCLEQLASTGCGGQPVVGRILKLALFIHSRSHADFLAKRRQITAILKKFFQGNPPPLSVIAQSPEEGSDVVLYAEALLPEAGEAVLRYHLLAGIPYGTVQYQGHREVFGAGLTADSRFRGTPAQSTEAFRLMTQILTSERLSVDNVVRQWNYVESILRLRPSASGKRQNYQEFNDVRGRFYEECHFPAGFPAATGIGMAHGGVLIEFQAVSSLGEFRVVPLSNPLQVDAHRYSQDALVGDRDRDDRLKAPPLFERGKYLGRGGSGIIYISGTAAVRGEATSPEGDVESQTRITIANIQSLISESNLSRHGIETVRPPGPLSYLRAYVKRRADLPAVKSVCRQIVGAASAHYLTADICRDDLLVELEGVVPVKTRDSLFKGDVP